MKIRFHALDEVGCDITLQEVETNYPTRFKQISWQAKLMHLANLATAKLNEDDEVVHVSMLMDLFEFSEDSGTYIAEGRFGLDKRCWIAWRPDGDLGAGQAALTRLAMRELWGD